MRRINLRPGPVQMTDLNRKNQETKRSRAVQAEGRAQVIIVRGMTMDGFAGLAECRRGKRSRKAASFQCCLRWLESMEMLSRAGAE
jgi:hypothetical protein